MTRRALVLGGGGITGIAWEIGIVAGLADRGVDVRSADLVVGTSAGSIVGALLFSGPSLEEIYESQLSELSPEVGARMGLSVLLRYLPLAFTRNPRRARARLGRLALSAATTSEAERRRVFEETVPVREWPQHPHLLVTAVDAETGEPTVFDRARGVPLIDAVAASSAVPMVWPPVTIDGRRYMDGGARSIVNADLAAGADEVVVIAPIDAALRKSGRISYQLDKLGSDVRAVVVTPDPRSRKAIGRQVLDTRRTALAVRAGRDQGRAEADRVGQVWSAAGIREGQLTP